MFLALGAKFQLSPGYHTLKSPYSRYPFRPLLTLECPENSWELNYRPGSPPWYPHFLAISRPSEGGRVVRLLGQPLGDRIPGHLALLERVLEVTRRALLQHKAHRVIRKQGKFRFEPKRTFLEIGVCFWLLVENYSTDQETIPWKVHTVGIPWGHCCL